MTKKRKTAKKPKRPKVKKLTAVLTRTTGTSGRGSMVKVKEVKWSIEPDKSEAEERAAQTRREVAAYWQTAAGLAMHLRLDVAMIVLRGMKARGWKPKDLAKRTRYTLTEIREIMSGDFDLDTDGVGELLHVLDTHANLNVRY